MIAILLNQNSKLRHRALLPPQGEQDALEPRCRMLVSTWVGSTRRTDLIALEPLLTGRLSAFLRSIAAVSVRSVLSIESVIHIPGRALECGSSQTMRI